MSKYYIYGNSGGIDTVIKDLRNPKEFFSSLKDVFNKLIDDYSGLISMGDLSVSYYGYDDRLKKDVYIIGVSRCGREDYIKKYGCPQCIKYMICL